VLLPFVKDFVPEVNIEAGVVEITPPGGLFESVPDES
jgi:16S rRNA processing protein RimM